MKKKKTKKKEDKVEKGKKREGKNEKPTTPAVPRRSPIQVLSGPDAA